MVLIRPFDKNPYLMDSCLFADDTTLSISVDNLSQTTFDFSK